MGPAAGWRLSRRAIVPGVVLPASGREPPTSSPFPGPVSRPGNRGWVGVAEKGVWKVSLGPGEGGVGGGGSARAPRSWSRSVTRAGGTLRGRGLGRFTAVNNGSRIRTQGRKRLESGEISSGTRKLRTNL